MRLCYLLPWIHTAGQVLGQLRQPASFHAAPSARRCVQATTHVGVFILCVGEGRGGEGREAARLAKVRAEKMRAEEVRAEALHLVAADDTSTTTSQRGANSHQLRASASRNTRSRRLESPVAASPRPECGDGNHGTIEAIF